MRSEAPFTGARCWTPAHVPGPGPSEKLSPSMSVPSCGLVVFVHATPLTPAQTPAFTSRWSHEDSVFAESCRNTAVVVPESQAADTFPRALGSKVHGVPETKSPSTIWFAVSARSAIPAAPMLKVGSKLPFAANSPGRSHERL